MTRFIVTVTIDCSRSMVFFLPRKLRAELKKSKYRNLGLTIDEISIVEAGE